MTLETVYSDDLLREIWLNKFDSWKIKLVNVILRVVDNCSRNEYFVILICILCQILFIYFVVCLPKYLSSFGV